LPKSISDANKIIADTATGTLRYQASLVDKAASMLGLHERDDKEALKSYLRQSGSKSGQIDPSETPWCAAFVNSTLAQSGIMPTGSNVAASYLNWGELKASGEVAAGDVLVREGHVGLSTGQTRLKNGRLQIQMLGGNQSNRVTNNNWVDADSIQVRRAREEDYNPEVLAEIKRNEMSDDTITALQQKQQQSGGIVQEASSTVPGEKLSQQQPGQVSLFKTDQPAPAQLAQVAQTSDEVIPVHAEGGAKKLDTKEITAYPIGPLKGDNSVVVDDDKKPLFTMNTDKESAHYDPNDKTVSIRPIDEKKDKLDKKPIVGKAIPVLADGGEVDLQTPPSGEPVSKVDSNELQATPNNEPDQSLTEPNVTNAGAMAQASAMSATGSSSPSAAESLKNMSANPITCPSFGRALAAANFKKSGDHFDGGSTNLR
jgi:uncharacterized protein (TIGR02594 family)